MLLRRVQLCGETLLGCSGGIEDFRQFFSLDLYLALLRRQLGRFFFQNGGLDVDGGKIGPSEAKKIEIVGDGFFGLIESTLQQSQLLTNISYGLLTFGQFSGLASDLLAALSGSVHLLTCCRQAFSRLFLLGAHSFGRHRNLRRLQLVVFLDLLALQQEQISEFFQFNGLKLLLDANDGCVGRCQFLAVFTQSVPERLLLLLGQLIEVECAKPHFFARMGEDH